jgi:uncharacterized protein involved in response to NO
MMPARPPERAHPKTIPLRTIAAVPAVEPTTLRGVVTRLLTVPHRFFFVVAMILLAATAGVWLWAMLSRAGEASAPPFAIVQPVWHVLGMLYGFFPFYMFGFLFTAGPKWLMVDPPRPGVWMPLGVLAAAGALTMLFTTTPFVATLGAAVFGLAWLAMAGVFVRLILASPATDRVHATLTIMAMLAGASGPIAYALVGDAAYPWLVFAGLWLFAVPVFVVVCHRMIPYFTANVLPTVVIFRPWWLLALLLGGPLAHGAIAAAGAPGYTWLVDVPLAVFAFDLARRWGLAQSLSNRLLAMLHVGFVWYAIAFALYAIASVCAFVGHAGVLGAAPAHAISIGFCGSLMVAMVSRVTFGHSGRTLAADRFTWGLFLLLQATVIVRICAALWPWPAALALGAALWAACVLPWSLRNAPIYGRARADGKPG